MRRAGDGDRCTWLGLGSESGRRTGGEGLNVMMGGNTDEIQGAYVECTMRVNRRTVEALYKNHLI